MHFGITKVSFQISVLPLTRGVPLRQVTQLSSLSLFIHNRENTVISEGCLRTDGEKVCEAVVSAWSIKYAIRGSCCRNKWPYAFSALRYKSTQPSITLCQTLLSTEGKREANVPVLKKSITCRRTDFCNSIT